MPCAFCELMIYIFSFNLPTKNKSIQLEVEQHINARSWKRFPILHIENEDERHNGKDKRQIGEKELF